MNTEIRKLTEDFKKKIFKPVYFLHGEEEYYHDYIEKELISEALEPSEVEMNLQLLYGRDVSLNEIVAFAREVSMWSGRKVVVVREAQDLKEWKSVESRNNSAGIKAMMALLENPVSENILFFSYKHGSPDKRGSLYKALLKHAVVLESRKIYPDKVPSWVNAYVKMYNRSIQPLAASLISENVGNDLNRLHLELQKIFLTVPEGAEITVKDVKEKTGMHKEFTVFEFQQALAKRDVARAMKMALFFGRNEKDHPMVMILASLWGYFQKILQVHYLSDKSNAEVARALGVHPYFAGEYVEASANYSTARLKKIFSLLREYDMKSKGLDNQSKRSADLLPELVMRMVK